ncbi:hypothetical protein SCOR_07840 [Sulfidibacter corallicola]|uniref:Alginate export domain-containing protein n=1 Tax=Sulfidibacter corallicola TaxID=2818388 RepID=A0A8A4TXR4_SULCO|nr:hypothetical protein [Sulfidibacter corallicola]QTD51325.1 hypothetical protein J3U87_02555 [Sulfidibacter corallicola]
MNTRISKHPWKLVPLLLIATTLPLFAAEAESLRDSLKRGKLLLNLRFRYEHVDQTGLDKEAHAATLRTRLGFETASYRGFQFLVDFENITVTGPTRYNDTTGNEPTRPVVADPEDTELNRAQLTYRWAKGQRLVVGRQRIIHDQARFVGNVGWRQNEQTFDAVTFAHDKLGPFKVTASYLDNVNRIFGEHHPSNGDLRLQGYLAHAVTKPWAGASLSLFFHGLDPVHRPAAAHRNLGFRVKGAWPPKSAKGACTYRLSWVDQQDFADGDPAIDVAYLDLGLGYKRGPFSITAGWEVLEGNGEYGFSTPLATLHAFNGWADVFLNTPVFGLEDRSLAAAYKDRGWKVIVVAHQFEAESEDVDYGDEIDLLIAKSVTKKLGVGLKAARYEADLWASDRTKVWLFADWRF